MKRIYTGLEDSGKSYMLAYDSVQILYRNAKWHEMGLPVRPIRANMAYTDKFLDLAAQLKIPVHKWQNLEDLREYKHCDLIIDEVGTYFDSRTFAMLPLDIRLWLGQASKLGVDIYGGAQDFAQVDISFRRLTTELYHIRKFVGSQRPDITRPSSKRIWGLCLKKEMNPVGYDENKKAFNNKGVIPWPFTIRRDYCEVFDTTKRVAMSDPPPFRHVARACADPSCSFQLYQIIHGQKHKVLHI